MFHMPASSMWTRILEAGDEKRHASIARNKVRIIKHHDTENLKSFLGLWKQGGKTKLTSNANDLSVGQNEGKKCQTTQNTVYSIHHERRYMLPVNKADICVHQIVVDIFKIPKGNTTAKQETSSHKMFEIISKWLGKNK